MSSNQSQVKYQGLIVLLLFLGLAFNFNNCGRSPNIEGSDLANRTMDARMRAVKTVNDKQVPFGFCAQGANYECLHKVFSASVPYEEFAATPQCILGGSLCVQVRSRTYNSAVLAQECPECEISYDEYECHAKLPDASGLYPLVITDRSFDGALRQVRELCLAVSGGR